MNIYIEYLNMLPKVFFKNILYACGTNPYH